MDHYVCFFFPTTSPKYREINLQETKKKKRPHGYGGIAIFWPKFLHNCVTVHSEGDHRVIVVTLSTDDDNIHVCFINLYMPC